MCTCCTWASAGLWRDSASGSSRRWTDWIPYYAGWSWMAMVFTKGTSIGSAAYKHKPYRIAWVAMPAASLTRGWAAASGLWRSEEHTSELQSHSDLVCRLLVEKKKHRRDLS